MILKIKQISTRPVFSKLEIPIAAFLVVFITIFTLMPVQLSFASELVNPLITSPQIIPFRDISDLSPTASPIITLDKPLYLIGKTAQITITDPNANVDLSNIDSITAMVSSKSVPLTETGGASTGIFVGSFTVTGPVNVNYTPDNPASPRATVTLDTNAIGKVHIKDIELDTAALSTLTFKAITQPIEVTLSDGAVLTPATNVFVQMSMANAVLDPGDDLTFAVMYYKPASPPGAGWVKVSLEGDTSTGGDVDFGTFTITNNPANYAAAINTGEGQYILGFDTGGAGGGSVGLVSSSLVLNFLAGAGHAENTVTPPSFGGGYNHYSDGLTFTQGTDTSTLDTSKYNQELPKQVMLSGNPVSMTFKTFENYNPTAIIHMGLYIIPRGQDMITSNSIGSIVWEKGKPVEVNDPNNILSDTVASSTDDGKFQYTKFSFVPEKSYDKMSFLVRAWNDHKYSADIRVHDDIETSPVLKTLPAGVVKYDDFNDLQAALEKDKFYKPQVMAHIHSTTDVFSSTDGGHLYWLYDTINHSVTLVIVDKNDNELYSTKASLDPIVPDKKGDYGFMQFTVKQLNRQDEQQEKQVMEIEAAKAMTMALEKGLMPHYNW
jgi:hypothetical protein